MLMRNSEYRRIRGLRHQQQRHHALAGRWVRSAWNGTVAGFGDFSGRANETDMLMRNSNTGAFEVYDIANNTITSAAADGPGRAGMAGRGLRRFLGPRRRDRHADAQQQHRRIRGLRHQSTTRSRRPQPMGQVGLEWTIAGFGDFSGNANETDMLMRNSNTGVFELYDISNNTITRGRPRWARSAWNGRSAACRPAVRPAAAPPSSADRPAHPGDGLVRAERRRARRVLAARSANGTSANQHHLADDKPRLAASLARTVHTAGCGQPRRAAARRRLLKQFLKNLL